MAKAGARRRLRAARALHFMRPQLCKSGKRECCGAQVLLQASFSQTTHANMETYCNEPVPTIRWREGLFDGTYAVRVSYCYSSPPVLDNALSGKLVRTLSRICYQVVMQLLRKPLLPTPHSAEFRALFLSAHTFNTHLTHIQHIPYS